MARTRIKICGITREQDAQAAAQAGADAIGLVFHAPSPRAVTPERAAEIAAAVPPFVTLVGLFVDAPAARVRDTLAAVPLQLLQFQGDEDPAYCAGFQRPWVKAVRVRPGVDVQRACADYAGARALLLDTWREGVAGGTGETFDWRLVATPLPLPLILAGGLNEHNVGAAIGALQPSAVDISGGVEAAPGEKDHAKIRRFVSAVRAADQAMQDGKDDG